jgi:hypothetical protein
MNPLFPSHFDPQQSKNYRLILHLQSGGCAVALSDDPYARPIHYCRIDYKQPGTMAENIKEIFYDNTFLALPYKKLQILLPPSATFTFVPTILFEKKNKDAYLDFNLYKRSGACLYQSLQQPPIHIIFEVDSAVCEFFRRSLIHPQFIHPIAPLTSFFLQKVRLGNNHKMIINLNDDTLDVLCFSPDELLLANNFDYRNADDILYHTLFIWKQLQFDQLHDSVYVIDPFLRHTALTETLGRYLKNVITFQMPVENLPAQVPAHIPALFLCES